MDLADFKVTNARKTSAREFFTLYDVCDAEKYAAAAGPLS